MVFIIFYVFCGIGVVGTILSTVGETLMERQEKLTHYLIMEVSVRLEMLKLKKTTSGVSVLNTNNR